MYDALMHVYFGKYVPLYIYTGTLDLHKNIDLRKREGEDDKKQSSVTLSIKCFYGELKYTVHIYIRWLWNCVRSMPSITVS